MKFSRRLKSMILCALVVPLSLASFSGSAYASGTLVNPWDPYAKYIPDTAPVEKRHLRATWVSTVINLDWPSKESTQEKNDAKRIEKQKAELVQILDEAVELKLNAVIFQVRPSSDALYQSELAPWSYFLTGKLNGNPGFDPLAFVIEEAHARNLELHAWVNPYRVSMPASSYGLKNLDQVRQMLSKEPKNIYAKHPEWVKVAQERLVLDPGIPGAREYVEDCIMEIVENYDMDAIHFDDYFYIGVTGGSDGINDTATYNTYNKGQFKNIEDWRRNNIQTLVENVSEKIKEAKPWVKFGISPSGVWRNLSKDPLGSATNAGVPNYDRDYADTRKWVLENTIDYICPQIYWSFGLAAAGFGVIAEWWSDLLRDHPESHVQLYVGEGLYRLVEPGSDSYWSTKSGEGYKELERQLKYNLARPEVSGSVLFRHANLSNASVKPAIENIQNNLWTNIALVPAMPHLGGTAPSAPELVSVKYGTNGNTLVWSNAETDGDELAAAKYYAVYRVPAGKAMDIENAEDLVALVRCEGDVTSFTDETGKTGQLYAVTALNRLHDESGPSKGMPAK